MIRPDKDTYYLDIALAVSKRSTCLKRHYGCVIVKEDVIVSTGYNGAPRGELNCCDTKLCMRANAQRYSNYDECPAVHSEQNAIIAVDRSKLVGSTLYLACEDVTHEDTSPKPCSICEKMIRNAGIKRIVTRKGELKWDL